MAHQSLGVDRTGFLADENVVYLGDRLGDLVDRGELRSAASRQLSFMGAVAGHTLSTLRLDTGPEAAKMLRDDGVDAVL